jgi:hypothetical protein
VWLLDPVLQALLPVVAWTLRIRTGSVWTLLHQLMRRTTVPATVRAVDHQWRSFLLTDISARHEGPRMPVVRTIAALAAPL